MRRPDSGRSRSRWTEGGGGGGGGGGGVESVSRVAGSAKNNPSEPSPAALYARIFGAEFKDPNAADFKPDQAVLVRKSVLSYVTDSRKAFMSNLGAADRARLDQYFTSIRQIEQQLDLELQKPAPLAACSVPAAPAEDGEGTIVEQVEKNNALFGALLAHAVACGQTRVFNVFTGSQGLRKAGSTETWHGWTHEEPIEEKLGYQPQVAWFVEWANRTFAQFLTQLLGAREGAGSVLDRVLVLWQTDHASPARIRWRTSRSSRSAMPAASWQPVCMSRLPGDPTTRVGLTIQQPWVSRSAVGGRCR